MYYSDPEFMRLVHNPTPEEYAQMEGELITNGCKEPIVIWGTTIIYDYWRYSICQKNHIPFEITKMDFLCRDDAVRWLVLNHLADMKQDPVLYHYQLGKRCNAERNLSGIKKKNKESMPADEESEKQKDMEPVSCRKLLRIYGISITAMMNYKYIAEYIDIISEKEPRLAELYLSRQVRIKTEDLKTISELPKACIYSLVNSLIRNKKTVCRSEDILGILSEKDIFTVRKKAQERKRGVAMSVLPSVKDMPVYSPDAEIESLTLTIPSWNSSVSRIFNDTEMRNISQKAKTQLLQEATSLKESIELLILAIEEENGYDE